jgi:hypothetical protein
VQRRVRRHRELLTNRHGRETVTPSASLPSEPTPSGTPSPEPLVRDFGAEDLIGAMADAGIPVGEVIVYNRKTDGNKLLGRPHGYVEKADWEDTRTDCFDFKLEGYSCGGTIELFDDFQDLKSRFAYLKAYASAESVGGIPVGGFYMWRTQFAVIRVGTPLTRQRANEYDDFINSYFERSVLRYRGA